MPHTAVVSESTSVPSPAPMKKCAVMCLDCSHACNEAIRHCLEKGGLHLDANHIRLLMDCAEICETSADFLARGSNQHEKTCGLCADICAQCAEDCRRLGGEEMNECADICDRCAESCRNMSGH